MKYTYSEYRQKAWDSLTGKWGKAALLMFVYMVVSAIISAIAGNQPSWRWIFFILTLAMFPMGYVMTVAFLKVAKGEEVAPVKALFDPYKTKETCLRYFLVVFWVNLFVFLWSLLLIIPGIIKAYAYSMTIYIAEENPDMDPREAMKKSEEMMKGHKWELFVLDLTFIGWLLLSMLTLGILMLFVQPYIYTTHGHFYLSLKEDAEPVVECASAKPEPVVEEAKAEPAAEEVAAAKPEEPEETPTESESSDGGKE